LFAAGPDGVLGTADDVPITGGTVSYRRDLNIVSLQFNSPLANGNYRAVLKSAVTDLAGNHLASDVSMAPGGPDGPTA
jgi:hypothetical protein